MRRAKNDIIVGVLVFAFACGFVAWTWHQEGNNIKALASMGDEDQLYGRKSIMEDIAYWFWPAKWEQYQQERQNRQAERATMTQCEVSLQALAAKRKD